MENIMRYSQQALSAQLRLFLFIASTLVCHCAISQDSSNASAKGFDENNYALLSMWYQRQKIGGGVEAYIEKDTIYVSLLDTFLSLDLEVQINGEIASGWFINQQTIYTINRSDTGWSLTLGTTESSAQADEIRLHNGTLFMDSNLLKRWLGITLTLNFSESTLEFDSLRELPIQKRLKRLNRRYSSRELQGTAQNPTIKIPYQGFEVPSAAIHITHTTFRNEKKDLDFRYKTQYTLSTYGDLFAMNTNFFITGNPEGDITGARMQMERRDHESSMLGIMKASRVSIGDIETISLADAPTPRGGKGIVISNNEFFNEINVETIIIEGNHPPGWDVELYSNNALLGITTIGEDGRYVFSDIASFSGRNDFTLRFYGPGGREEIEERTINVGPINDGSRFTYKVSLQDSEQVFSSELNKDNELFNTKIATIKSTIALSQYLALSLNYQHQQEEDNDLQFSNIGLSSNLGPINFAINGTKNDEGVITARYGLSSQFRSLRLKLEATNTDTNHKLSDDGPKSYRINIGSSLLGLPIAINATKKENGSDEQFIYTAGLAGTSQGVVWGMTNNYTKDISDTGIERLAAGSLTVGKSSRFGSFRAAGFYQIRPQAEVTAATLGTSLLLGRNSTLNIGTTFDRLRDRKSYNLGISWILPYAQITPSVSYNNDGNFSGFIRMTTAVSKRNTGNKLHLKPQRTSTSNTGNIRLRLFEDLNQDGHLSSNEPLLQGGKVKALQARRRGTTDAEGNIWLDNIPAWIPTDIEYQEGSISSAEVQYSGKPFSALVHPGSTTAINLPFLRVGEIDGFVQFDHANHGKSAAENKIVKLIDAKGNVVQRQRTSYDGFFLFQKVRPGTYSLTVDGAQFITTPKKVIILREGNIVSGQQLVIAAEEIKPSLQLQE